MNIGIAEKLRRIKFLTLVVTIAAIPYAPAFGDGHMWDCVDGSGHQYRAHQNVFSDSCTEAEAIEVTPPEKTPHKKPKPTQKKPRLHGVAIGMNQAEVLASSWGKPRRVNKTITARHIREQWVYGGGEYLYFEDGILTTIQK